MSQSGFGFEFGAGFEFGGQGGLNFDGPMFDDAAMRAQAERERKAREEARQREEQRRREEREKREKERRERHGFNSRSYVDPHDVLGVPYGATSKEIRAAWAALCKQYHPDAVGGDAERIKAINVAYNRLRGKR